MPVLSFLLVLGGWRSDLAEVVGEGFEDVVGGVRPDGRSGVLVPFVDPAADVPFEFDDAPVGRAAEFAAGQRSSSRRYRDGLEGVATALIGGSAFRLPYA